MGLPAMGGEGKLRQPITKAKNSLKHPVKIAFRLQEKENEDPYTTFSGEGKNTMGPGEQQVCMNPILCGKEGKNGRRYYSYWKG